jgi:formylmethanofuran dehydrogenase subunit E
VPKRRVGRGTHPRRLGSPAARAHLREARELQREVFGYCGSQAIDLNPPPVFGETFVAASDVRCASCPAEMADGDEGTYIDGEPNCRECTEEARRG